MNTGLPRVKIAVIGDQLGQVQATSDGVTGMVLTGVAVAGKVSVGLSYQLFNLKEAEALGIEATGSNAYPYKQIKRFYDKAPNGTPLWIMLVATTVSMETMADKTEPYAKKLVDDAKGAIRLLGLSRKSATGVTVSNGLDEDVAAAQIKAQELVKSYVEKYKEFSVVIDGKDFNGTVADLKNYRESDKEFVSILIANSDGGKNADVGLLLGTLAGDPVQRSPARVKSGALPIDLAYFTNGDVIEKYEDAWDTIHNLGYIFMRAFVGRTGYFFTDAPTTILGSSDFNDMTRVRAIYKARRVAYNVLVQELNDEVPLQADGTIVPAFVKSYQGAIDNALAVTMTANGEISDAKSNVPASQNVLGTNTLMATVKVLPVGYSKYIDVELSFAVSLN